MKDVCLAGHHTPYNWKIGGGRMRRTTCSNSEMPPYLRIGFTSQDTNTKYQKMLFSDRIRYVERLGP